MKKVHNSDMPGQNWSVSFEYFPALTSLTKDCKKISNFSISLVSLAFKKLQLTSLACQGHKGLQGSGFFIVSQSLIFQHSPGTHTVNTSKSV
jgi:hypothetical protein